jgi:predicted nucleic acid-binding Zn ribbon protein
MGNRQALDEINRILELKERKRKRRFRVMLLLLLIILVFLIPWQCSENAPQISTVVTPTPMATKADSPAPDVHVGNQRYSRPEFINGNETKVAWGRHLSLEIDRYATSFRQCLITETEIVWIFQFNPGTGEIRHQSFSDRNGDDIESKGTECLRDQLPTSIRMIKDYGNAWFRTQITIVSHQTR